MLLAESLFLLKILCCMTKITWWYLILVHLHTCHHAHLLLFLRKQPSNNHTDFREFSSKRKKAPPWGQLEISHISYKGDSKDYKLAEGHTQILGTHMMNPHLTNHRPNPLTRSPTFLVATSYRYREFQPQCLSSTTSYPSEGHGGTIHWGMGLTQELIAGIPRFVLERLPDYLAIVVHIFSQTQAQIRN